VSDQIALVNAGASEEEAAGIIRDIYRSGLDALKL
jgi:hypothetical protein